LVVAVGWQDLHSLERRRLFKAHSRTRRSVDARTVCDRCHVRWLHRTSNLPSRCPWPEACRSPSCESTSRLTPLSWAAEAMRWRSRWRSRATGSCRLRHPPRTSPDNGPGFPPTDWPTAFAGRA